MRKHKYTCSIGLVVLLFCILLPFYAASHLKSASAYLSAWHGKSCGEYVTSYTAVQSKYVPMYGKPTIAAQLNLNNAWSIRFFDLLYSDWDMGANPWAHAEIKRILFWVLLAYPILKTESFPTGNYYDHLPLLFPCEPGVNT